MLLAPCWSRLSAVRIILASQSPRRSDILSQSGIVFEKMPSSFEEDLDKDALAPPEYVQETARHKALDVLTKLDRAGQSPVLVIGSDTGA